MALTPEEIAAINAGSAATAQRDNAGQTDAQRQRAYEDAGLRDKGVAPTGQDVFGNAIPSSTPSSTPSSSYYPRYSGQEQAAQDYLGTFTQPKTAEQLQAEGAKAAQAEIDALNRHYDSLLGEQKIINEGRDRGTASVNTLSGLGGSSEANVAQQKTTGLNQQDNAKIQNERAVAISGVLSKIRTSAVEEARAQRVEARQGATDVLAARTARQTEAHASLTELAKSGVTAEGLKSQDPESYAHLVQSLGGEQQLKALMILNRPQESILDKRVEGGKYVIAYQNPLTGAVRMESMDLGFDVPPEYKVADLGNQLMFYDPANPESNPFYKSKGIDPGTASHTGGGAPGAGGEYKNDLDAVIGATLATIPSKFGQSTFQSQIAKARNDSDKLNLVAATVLKGQPAEMRTDFANQAAGIAEVDKAIAEIDAGVQTGVINDKLQYAYNIVGKDYDPKLAKINSHITAAIQPYRNSVTGAAWGAQEDAEYQALFGSTKYSPAELKTRLTNLKEILKTKSATGLNTFVNPMGFYDNQFATGNFAPTGEIVQSPDGPIEIVD